MGQMGFYDLDKRLEAISAKGDSLELIKATVPWESFRAEIEAVTRPKPAERKSTAGRKPYDAILMFKILVLQTLHNLADEQLEYLIRDRYSFMAGKGRTGRQAVCALQPASRGQGLYRARRPDRRCYDRVRANAAQQPERERGDQGRQDAGGLTGETGQECPERQGCPLGQEARP